MLTCLDVLHSMTIFHPIILKAQYLKWKIMYQDISIPSAWYLSIFIKIYESIILAS